MKRIDRSRTDALEAIKLKHKGTMRNSREDPMKAIYIRHMSPSEMLRNKKPKRKIRKK